LKDRARPSSWKDLRCSSVAQVMLALSSDVLGQGFVKLD
jgi:hypothetical protein